MYARSQRCLGLGLGLENTTKPRAPETLQLEKACQGEHSTATTLLSPHISPWHPTPMCLEPQPQEKAAFTALLRVRVKVYIRNMFFWCFQALLQKPSVAVTKSLILQIL